MSKNLIFARVNGVEPLINITTRLRTGLEPADRTDEYSCIKTIFKRT
jgi:hypothetical protein